MHPETRTAEVATRGSSMAESEHAPSIQPADYLDTIRAILHSGEVRRSGSSTSEIEKESVRFSEEARKWAASLGIAEVSSGEEDFYLHEIEDGFADEVRILTKLAARANRKDIEIPTLGEYAESQREEIYGYLLSDYLQCAGAAAGHDGRISMNLLRKNPVLFHGPEYIGELSEKYVKVSKANFQRIITNNTQNPEEGLDAYCQQEGIHMAGEETASEEVIFSGKAYLENTRTLLREGFTRTIAYPNKELGPLLQGIQQNARRLAEGHPALVSFSEEERALLRESLADKVKLVGLATDRAWKRGLVDQPLSKLPSQQQSELTEEILAQHLEIASALSAGEPYTTEIMRSNLVLYHSPESAAASLQRHQGVPRSYILRLVCNYPKSFENSLATYADNITLFRDKYPGLSESAAQWILAAGFPHPESTIRDSLGLSEETAYLKGIPEISKEIERTAAEERSELSLVTDRLLDFMWTDAQGPGKCFAKSVSMFKSWHRELFAVEPQRLVKALQLLCRLGTIEKEAASKDQTVIWLTEKGYQQMNQAM